MKCMNSSETLTTAHSLLHLHSYTKKSLWTLLRHWAIMDGDESRVIGSYKILILIKSCVKN